MFLSIVVVAIVALAMDAFSISITKGFSLKNLTTFQTLSFGLFFAGFQVLMPIFGWIAGERIKAIVISIAPIVAFVLLSFIGLKMIYESLYNDEEHSTAFSYKELVLLSIATSIDAFVVGITFSLLNIAIFIPLLVIGLITFTLSEIGVIIGKTIGNFVGDKFEIVGRVVLIILGINILLDGFGV